MGFCLSLLSLNYPINILDVKVAIVGLFMVYTCTMQIH